jgi:hypothetical protein
MIQLRRHGTLLRALVLALIASLLIAPTMPSPARLKRSTRRTASTKE